MAFRNIALIGGTGTVGAPILQALKSSPFKVSVLNRQSSKSTYADTHVITIPDDLDVQDLTRLLKESNIDVLIIAIAGGRAEQAKKLIEAAFNAGVKRVIPNDFGSCDSTDAKTNEVYPTNARKKSVRDYLISLQDQDRGDSAGKLTWTSLIPGHFFDWGFTNELLKFNVKKRKAYIIDGGDIKFSASNLDFIAKAVVKILQAPDETANKILYIHSHYVTQNEVLASLEKATGERWEKIPQNSEDELKRERPGVLAGDRDAAEVTVAVWGLIASDWKDKEEFANKTLGLQEEDLDETIRKVVAEQ